MKQRSRIVFSFGRSACLVFLLFACLNEQKSSPIPQGAPAEKEYPTMRVWGRHLHTAYNEKVILRGINHLFIWVDKDGDPSLAEIAQTGANAARLVWLTSGRAHELDRLIINCLLQKMIPMIELHDATGKWEKLEMCVDYWVRPDIAAVIKRHQKFLLINIANEVGDNTVTRARFTEGYTKAVTRMRRAGIAVPLIIDAPDWGKDFTTLKESAAALVAADPLHNLMFSIHMWWPKMWNHSEATVRAAIQEAVTLNLPLIVGEFGNEWEQTAQGKIPYLTIIEECQKNEIGWLAWSWGPGNKPQTWLNMTEDGWFDTLFGWGLEVAVTSPYSIKNTSRKPDSLEKIATLGLIPVPLPAPD